ncbi:MFS transporter [Aneurinibacillus sp. Ricciae_BoGa-3]|uniref:MFS transporter n=1 Tax=Aneurinibacillus sp. Ricciae_BoGa-3 TaxID=3022697 RepID=UPI0023406A33|nr:MFS transporter [Aneurinibacillus sp. Ricciae_BoGa-3]WCK52349.1 MFS transporter [Aneurinibacillus sp. Ricciae_BoGa-3]
MSEVSPVSEVVTKETVSVPWYQALGRKQWYTLIAANLGWMFDGYETYALILTVGLAVKQLLTTAHLAEIPFYAGLIIAITLLGWGIGGILGGILADYIGRRKAMMISILAYSITTGLSAFSWSLASLVIFRFIVGLCIGSEWGTGTAIMAEVWPDNARAKGAGLMQSGLGIGFFIASAVWYFMSGMGPNAWRIMFLIGVLPALATLWVRKSVDESKLWDNANKIRKEASAKSKRGETLNEEEQHYTKFTLSELFSDRKLRRLTILGSLMSLTTTVGWWGISTWVPSYVASIAAQHQFSAAQWASLAGMIYNVGAIGGYILLGFLADSIGRKTTTILYFFLSLVLTPILFLFTHNLYTILIFTLINGIFTLGQYTWMPVWLPECFPTRIRGTAVAFVFNAARFVAFLGPLCSGLIISKLGGYGIAATVVGLIYLLGFVVAFFYPETKGQQLPE